MQPRDERVWLWDARKACEFVLRCVEGRTLDGYLADEVIRAAVERQFEIIGEAFKQTVSLRPELEAEFPVIRTAIKYRNFLSHAYHMVDDAKVYGIATESVPKLIDAIDEMLRRIATKD